MKKSMIALLFIFSVTPLLQAQNSDFLETINIGELTLNEKLILYTTLKKDSVFPTFMNGFIGFGSGSFTQSDYMSGFIGFFGDTISYGILLTAYGINSLRIMYLDKSGVNILIASGIACFILSKGYQLIAPSMYAGTYNKKIARKIFNY
jgi:hypothetical protein